MWLSVFLLICLLCGAEDISADGTDAKPVTDSKKAEITENAEFLNSFIHSNNKMVKASLASTSVILVSELGDKTFFIAAIMAMKHARWVVYIAAMAALATMTILAVLIGFALPLLIPVEWTHFLAGVLFFIFGLKLLYEGVQMESGVSDELEEVEQELAEKDGGFQGEDDPELGDGKDKLRKKQTINWSSKVFLEVATMTFLAEWGDRSQIATIALAAHRDPTGVCIGGCLGHGFCTALAVLGGKFLASRISEKHVTLIGGALFLVFGIHSFLVGPELE
jgi:putative Ca2+/H+ antiporter (TMEM165/GDT1 family)